MTAPIASATNLAQLKELIGATPLKLDQATMELLNRASDWRGNRTKADNNTFECAVAFWRSTREAFRRLKARRCRYRVMNEDDDSPTRVVFLFDVDNTLLDNDRVAADLQRHLASEIGAEGAQEYWRIFEQLRTELGYADYLGALQRYRTKHPRAPNLLCVSDFLINYSFAERLFSDALKVIEYVQQWGRLDNAISGRVLIYAHKEQELDEVEQRHPAEHYVLVDDKLRILAAAKKFWGSRVTTIFVRQGHYATDPKILTSYPAADISIGRVGDLLQYHLPELLNPKP